MKDRILTIIKENLSLEAEIEVQDASVKHLHHAHNFKRESHFEVFLSVKNLETKEKIFLQKKLTKALSSLYSKELVHSISILFK